MSLCRRRSHKMNPYRVRGSIMFDTNSGTFCAARPIQALEDPFEDDALDAMWHAMQNDIDSEGFAGLNLNHNIVVLDPVVRIHEVPQCLALAGGPLMTTNKTHRTPS